MQPSTVDFSGEERTVETHAGIQRKARDFPGRQAGTERRGTDERAIGTGGTTRGFDGEEGGVRGTKGAGGAADDSGFFGGEVLLECGANERGECFIGRIIRGDALLLDAPCRPRSGDPQAGDRDEFRPAARVNIHGAALAVDEAQMVVRTGEERAVGDERQDGAVGFEAGVCEHDGQRRGAQERREMLLRPPDGIGEIEFGADSEAEGREAIRREADDDGFVRPKFQPCGRRGVGLAVGRVENIAGEDDDAGRLDFRDGLGDRVEFGLVVAEVHDRGDARSEGGEQRKLHGAGAAFGDGVAEFERVAVDQHGDGHAEIFGAEAVDVREELRGAVVGRMQIARDEHDGVGGGRGGAAENGGAK